MSHFRKDDIGALAYEAHNNAQGHKFVDVMFSLVNVVSVVCEGWSIQASQSGFQGRIINTYETTAAYNIGGSGRSLWVRQGYLLSQSDIVFRPT